MIAGKETENIIARLSREIADLSREIERQLKLLAACEQECQECQQERIEHV